MSPRDADAVPRIVTALNLAGLAVSTAFTVRGLSRPEAAVADNDPRTAARFWAEFAAARTLPLALATASQLLSPRTAALPAMLLIAGAAQAGDAIIGARRGNRPMTVAPACMAALHLYTAARTLRTRGSA